MKSFQERQLEISADELEQFNLSRIGAYLEEFLSNGAYVIKEDVFVARIRQYATASQFEKIIQKLGIDWRKYEQIEGFDEEHWF